MKSDLIDLEVEIKAETDAAVLVSDGDKEAWLPKSQIEIERKGRVATVTLPEWLAIAKEFV